MDDQQLLHAAAVVSSTHASATERAAATTLLSALRDSASNSHALALSERCIDALQQRAGSDGEVMAALLFHALQGARAGLALQEGRAHARRAATVASAVLLPPPSPAASGTGMWREARSLRSAAARLYARAAVVAADAAGVPLLPPAAPPLPLLCVARALLDEMEAQVGRCIGGEEEQGGRGEGDGTEAAALPFEEGVRAVAAFVDSGLPLLYEVRARRRQCAGVHLTRRP